MELAGRNAAETLARETARWLADQGKTLAALGRAGRGAGIAGRAAGAHRVLRHLDHPGHQHRRLDGRFEEGRPRSGEYRRFRVRTPAVSAGRPDDYASHREVLRRRFYRALEGEEGSAEELRWRLPDLVIIDGGLGQANTARAVMDELGLHELPVFGLAKEREELWAPGATAPIVLPATSQALYLVQRIRDEAHRFAITYHRQLRAKAQTKSVLDDLPGVGPARKRALLKVFGSTKQMRSATVDEIAAVPGISRSLAEKIRAGLDA
jgi:excinuclease ABC subunit C